MPVAVYLSNQGAKQVYYNNLAVTLPPEHYSKRNTITPMACRYKAGVQPASGSLPNRQRYQGNEYREEAGLNWMDFHNREDGAIEIFQSLQNF